MAVEVHAHTSTPTGPGSLMVDAAEAAGLDALGFADHCSLSEAWREERLLWNRNFDRIYARRREALSVAADRTDLTLYDAVVSLVESKVFDVLAHVDPVENHPALRSLTTAAHRDQVAAACADSRTIPEINVR